MPRTDRAWSASLLKLPELASFVRSARAVPLLGSGFLLACGLFVSCGKAPPPPVKQEPAPTDKVEVKTPVTPVDPPSPDIPAPTDVAAAPPDAEKTATGLATKVLQKGTGDAHPHSYDSVKAHYTGWTTDGKMFDSSVKRGEPTTFGLGQVIAGWTEGLQLMVVGEKRRLWVPEPLAYKGAPGRPAGTLVFDVELLEIIPGEAPIPAPEDVAAPPADAKKTASGLSYKVLQKGKSNEKPKKYDRVTVHYTGWTTDGNSFDSSVKRGQPAVFGVSQVIEGWTEGLQLMSVGEKTRFWIPEQLAYKGKPGPPKGMLVFDVELISIERMPEPPAVPKDVAAPPKDAKKTATGLSYKILKKGKGKTHPATTDRVEVHYTGWTTDGKMFDSSVTRGKSITFGVTQVIPGWTEGLQLLVEGDTARLWIPEELAYKGRPGAPQGMLVFDVQLIRIEHPATSVAATPASASPPASKTPAVTPPAAKAAPASAPSAETKQPPAAKPASASAPPDTKEPAAAKPASASAPPDTKEPPAAKPAESTEK